MKLWRTPIAILLLALAATCFAQASGPDGSAGISSSPTIKRPRNAEDLLRRLLALIKDTKSVDQLTPEHVSNAIGEHLAEIALKPGTFFVEQNIATGWQWSMESKVFNGSVMSLDFSFEHDIDRDLLSIEPLCTMDFDKFSAQLVSSGYRRKTTQRSGRMMAEFVFEKSDTPSRIVIDTEATTNQPTSQPRDCVRRVQIVRR